MGRGRKRNRTKVEGSDGRTVEEYPGTNCKDIETENHGGHNEGLQRKKQKLKPLNGLIVAVSTLDVKGERHSESDSSYRTVREECIGLGASVTAQVHKRVFAVICNRSAVRNMTQRVRKALKRKTVLLIDFEWIRECKLQASRVSYDKYNLYDMAQKIVEESQVSRNLAKVKSESDVNVSSLDSDEAILRISSGWTEPVSLSCCCVCHETDRDDCKWCVSCPVTLSKKAKNICREATT